MHGTFEILFSTFVLSSSVMKGSADEAMTQRIRTHASGRRIVWRRYGGGSAQALVEMRPRRVERAQLWPCRCLARMHRAAEADDSKRRSRTHKHASVAHTSFDKQA